MLLNDLFTFRRLFCRLIINLVSDSFDHLSKKKGPPKQTDKISPPSRVFDHESHVTGEMFLVIHPSRPNSRQGGSSIPGHQPSESRTNNARRSVSVPPPLSQQGAAQALLHGGESHTAIKSHFQLCTQFTEFLSSACNNTNDP